VIGCPLHSPSCTHSHPNRWLTMVHGRYSSTPSLIRRQSSEGGGRRWRWGQTLNSTTRAGRDPAPRYPAPIPHTHPQSNPATWGRSPGQRGAGWGLLRVMRTPQPVSCGPSSPLRRPGRLHTAHPTTLLPTWDCGHINAPTGGDGGLRGACTSRMRASARLTEWTYALAAPSGKFWAHKGDRGGLVVIL